MALESLATLNSFIRTLLAVGVMGVLGAGGWYGYQTYYSKENAQAELARKEEQLLKQQETIRAMRVDLQAKEKEIVRLTTANRLLKMQHRVAQLSVLNQRTDPDTDQVYSKVRFVELNEEGEPITQPKDYELRGDVAYIDHWIVKFEDKYIEQADLERPSSIVMFRRLFGEQQKPADGYPLDPIGSHPHSYARGRISEFEEKIWNDFWNIANDQAAAAQLGIRAAHGDAVYIRLQEGKKYKLELRASDGMSITPDGEVAEAEPSA